MVTIIMETLGALFDPAFQGELPTLCEDAGSLHAMNALMSSNHRFARIFGPGMIGLLLLVIPLPHFFTIDAVSFALSAIALSLIGKGARQPNTTGSSSQRAGSPMNEALSAFLTLRQHRALFWAIMSLGLINMAWSAAFMVGVPLLAKQSFPGGAGGYGLIAGAYGVGNVISLLVTGGMALRRKLSIMFIGQLTLGIGFLIVAGSSSMMFALVGTVLAAFGSPMGDLIMLTMIQTDFPKEHVGKMYGVRSFVGTVGLTLGLLAAVPLFGCLSPSLGIGLCALAVVAIGVTGLLLTRSSSKENSFNLS